MVDAERLKELQEGHGGWNPRMREAIGQASPRRCHFVTAENRPRCLH